MYRRVLVPLDGTKVAESILSFIEEIAGPLDMEVVLFRVVRPSPEELMGLGRSVGLDSRDAREREAEEYLNPLAKRLWAKGLRASAEVAFGEPAREIIAAAKTREADLIAMATHARKGVDRLMFGSVAEEVLCSAPVPVFLMRMTEVALGSRAA
jgi:nucleotide-binding universal stress UspA family protein